MLRWALGFLIVAIVAALFGFGAIATTSVEIARLLFFIFVVGFVITLVLGLFRDRQSQSTHR
jgi:uncharacterized membrane protein YtjA (UPF0391 family)